MTYTRVWDYWLEGYFNCTCGRRTDFVAHDGGRDITCGGCGTVYRVAYRATIAKAPDEKQSGTPDFLGRLMQGLKEIDERQKKDEKKDDS